MSVISAATFSDLNNKPRGTCMEILMTLIKGYYLFNGKIYGAVENLIEKN